MTEPLPTREFRPHPLSSASIVIGCEGALHFAGETVSIIRTNARYGDALMVKEFERRDGLPIHHRLISVSDIASVDAAVTTSLFEGPQEALDYIAAHFPSVIRFYAPQGNDPPI